MAKRKRLGVVPDRVITSDITVELSLYNSYIMGKGDRFGHNGFMKTLAPSLFVRGINNPSRKFLATGLANHIWRFKAFKVL